MGKQIEFIHSEEDVGKFLSAVEKFSGRIIYGKSVVNPLTIEKYVLDQMTAAVSKFIIVHSELSHDFNNTLAYTNRNAIEFKNCCKANMLSRTYETGRLYIMSDEKGVYDKYTLSLYNNLCYYFRKNYYFSKTSQIYFSLSFKEKYDIKYYHAVRLGQPIHG